MVPPTPVSRRMAPIPAAMPRIMIVQPVLPIVTGLIAIVLPILPDLVAAVLPILPYLAPVTRRKLARSAFSDQPIVKRLPTVLDGTVRGKLADSGSAVSHPG